MTSLTSITKNSGTPASDSKTVMSIPYFRALETYHIQRGLRLLEDSGKRLLEDSPSSGDEYISKTSGTLTDINKS